MKLVEIPDRFKDLLVDRFNPGNAVEVEAANKECFFRIEITCALCKEYKYEDGHRECERCPFCVLYKRHGCIKWFDKVALELDVEEDTIEIFLNYILWSADDDEEVRRQLEKLRVAVLDEERFIKWV
ncbi:MAG: hypothetical protein HQ539_00230 [Parcubacteria group bacterium]|nr:hypothetical protein [Parcubacteria group bacterium]